MTNAVRNRPVALQSPSSANLSVARHLFGIAERLRSGYAVSGRSHQGCEDVKLRRVAADSHNGQVTS